MTDTPPPLFQSNIGLFDAENMEWVVESAESWEIDPGIGFAVVGGVFRKTGRTREEVLAALFEGKAK